MCFCRGMYPGNWKYSGFTKDHHTPCNESAMHGQNSFVTRSAYSEKKRLNDSSEETRHRHRKRYSLLTEEQRNALLHRNREYKKTISETMTITDHGGIMEAPISSPCTPLTHAQHSKIPAGSTDPLFMVFSHDIECVIGYFSYVLCATFR
jgi:hypothetical protein